MKTLSLQPPGDVTYVSRGTYDALVFAIDRRRTLRENLKAPACQTLAAKLAILAEIKTVTAEIDKLIAQTEGPMLIRLTPTEAR